MNESPMPESDAPSADEKNLLAWLRVSLEGGHDEIVLAHLFSRGYKLP